MLNTPASTVCGLFFFIPSIRFPNLLSNWREWRDRVDARGRVLPILHTPTSTANLDLTCVDCGRTPESLERGDTASLCWFKYCNVILVQSVQLIKSNQKQNLDLSKGAIILISSSMVWFLDSRLALYGQQFKIILIYLMPWCSCVEILKTNMDTASMSEKLNQCWSV